MDLLSSLLARASTAPDLSFAGFKLLWSAYGLPLIHLHDWRHPEKWQKPADTEDAPTEPTLFAQEPARGVQTRTRGRREEAAAEGATIAAIASPAAPASSPSSHADLLLLPDHVRLRRLFRFLTEELLEFATDALQSGLRPSSSTITRQIAENHIPLCVYAIFSLYTLYSTQLCRPRVRIVMEEQLWPVLEQLLSELSRRPATVHGAHALSRLLRGDADAIEWALALPRDDEAHAAAEAAMGGVPLAEWQTEPPMRDNLALHGDSPAVKELKTDFAVARAAAKRARRADEPRWIRATATALKELEAKQKEAYEALTASNGAGPPPSVPVHLDNLQVDLTSLLPFIPATARASLYEEDLQQAERAMPWSARDKTWGERRREMEQQRSSRRGSDGSKQIGFNSSSARPSHSIVTMASVAGAVSPTPPLSSAAAAAAAPYLFLPLPSVSFPVARRSVAAEALLPAVRLQRDQERGVWLPRQAELVPPPEWRGLPGAEHDDHPAGGASEPDDENPEMELVWRTGNEEEFVRLMRQVLEEDDGLETGKRQRKSTVNHSMPRLEDGDLDEGVERAVQNSVHDLVEGELVRLDSPLPDTPRPLSPSFLLTPFLPPPAASVSHRMTHLSRLPAEPRDVKPMVVKRERLHSSAALMNPDVEDDAAAEDSDEEIARKFKVWPMRTLPAAASSASPPTSSLGERSDFISELTEIRQKMMNEDTQQRRLYGLPAASSVAAAASNNSNSAAASAAAAASGSNWTQRALLLQQRDRFNLIAAAAATAASSLAVAPLPAADPSHMQVFRELAHDIQLQQDLERARARRDQELRETERQRREMEAQVRRRGNEEQKEGATIESPKIKAKWKAHTPAGLGSALENYRAHIQDGSAFAAAASSAEISLSLHASPPSRQASALLSGPALADLVSEQYASVSAIMRTPARTPGSVDPMQGGLQRAMSIFALDGSAAAAAIAQGGDEEKKQPDADDAASMPPPAAVPAKSRAALQQRMRQNKARTKANVERAAAAEGGAEEGERKDGERGEEKTSETGCTSEATASGPKSSRKRKPASATSVPAPAPVPVPMDPSSIPMSDSLRASHARLGDIEREMNEALMEAPVAAPPAKKAGRPKKNPQQASASTAAASAAAANSSRASSSLPGSLSSGLDAAGLSLFPDIPGLSVSATGAPPTPSSQQPTPLLSAMTAPSTPSFLPLSSFTDTAPSFLPASTFNPRAPENAAAAAGRKGRKPQEDDSQLSQQKRPRGRGKRKAQEAEEEKMQHEHAAESPAATAPASVPIQPKRSRAGGIQPSHESVLAAAARATAATSSTFTGELPSLVPLLQPMDRNSGIVPMDIDGEESRGGASEEYDAHIGVFEEQLPSDDIDAASDADGAHSEIGSEFSLNPDSADEDEDEEPRHHRSDALADRPSELPQARKVKQARRKATKAAPKQKVPRAKPASGARGTAPKPSRRRKAIIDAVATDRYRVTKNEFAEGPSNATKLLTQIDSLGKELAELGAMGEEMLM